MICFQVNNGCNGFLVCMQNFSARILEAKAVGGMQNLLYNMACCARCATYWTIFDLQ